MAVGSTAKPVLPVPLPRALTRERLTSLLPQVAGHRLTLIVGPAGSGKTTLLHQFASALDLPSAWFSAGESADMDHQSLLARLDMAFADLAPGQLEEGNGSGRQVPIHQGRGPACGLLVLDDWHVLEGTPTEETIGHMVERGFPGVVVLVASRWTPRLNLPRLRVSNVLFEIGADDLRFRSWEVERLFRDLYGEPLSPEDVASLSRRTEGWAAGLQLFHLATAGKPPSERHRTVERLGTRGDVTREYLARNVLAELPGVLRDFLVHTCVLGQLTGPLCDELLGQTGSDQVLAELERRQIFTSAIQPETYRYHEIFRAHLEAVLVEDLGENETRTMNLRAARLLEKAGIPSEATRSFLRAEAWSEAERLLGRHGQQIAEDPGAWVERVSLPLARNDPWVLLARARRHRSAGRPVEAIKAYQEAEDAFGHAAGARVCRRERAALAQWVDPDSARSSDWIGQLRRATTRDPLAVRRATRGLPKSEEKLVCGLASLLSGYVREAEGVLADLAADPDSSPAMAASAGLARSIALLLSGESRGAVALDRSADDLERAGLHWLARMARAALALTSRADGRSEAASVRLISERFGDAWGAALAGLLGGLGAVLNGERAIPALEYAVVSLRQLGAGVLEAWARAALGLAMARVDEPDARQIAVQAEGLARAAGVSGAQAFAYLALAEIDPTRGSEYQRLAVSIAQECSLALPSERDLPGWNGRVSTGAIPQLAISCLGGFRVLLEGRPVDLSTVKPRARQALRLLVLHAPHPMHREVLISALWPDADLEAGTRCLQVAISSLRRALDPLVPWPGGSCIFREADGYGLSPPQSARLDLLDFREAMQAGRVAWAAREIGAGVAAFNRAMALYRGDLMPEEGPADWIVDEREQYRAEAVTAAQILAEALIEWDPLGAVRACERGLRIDRYRDELWRLLIAAHERAGHPAGAARAAQRYESMLRELGVLPTLVLKPQRPPGPAVPSSACLREGMDLPRFRGR